MLYSSRDLGRFWMLEYQSCWGLGSARVTSGLVWCGSVRFGSVRFGSVFVSFYFVFVMLRFFVLIRLGVFRFVLVCFGLCWFV